MRLVISQDGCRAICLGNESVFVNIEPVPITSGFFSVGINNVSMGIYSTEERAVQVLGDLYDYMEQGTGRFVMPNE